MDVLRVLALVVLVLPACGSGDGKGGAGGSGGTSGTGATGAAGSGAKDAGAGSAGTSAGGAAGSGGNAGAPTCATLTDGCFQCHGTACSAEHKACNAIPDCQNAHGAAGACLCTAQNQSDTAALQQCIATEQAAGPEAKALIDCIVSNCSAECGL